MVGRGDLPRIEKKHMERHCDVQETDGRFLKARTRWAIRRMSQDKI